MRVGGTNPEAFYTRKYSGFRGLNEPFFSGERAVKTGVKEDEKVTEEGIPRASRTKREGY